MNKALANYLGSDYDLLNLITFILILLWLAHRESSYILKAWNLITPVHVMISKLDSNYMDK
jgi:hypothetical protein